MTAFQVQASPVLAPEATTYCATHPQVETMLRCNKCDQRICLKCAVLTPVGYRCKVCVRGQQAVYFNAQGWDNPLVFLTGLVIAGIATPVAGYLSASFYFGAFYAALLAGPVDAPGCSAPPQPFDGVGGRCGTTCPCGSLSFLPSPQRTVRCGEPIGLPLNNRGDHHRLT
jgi:hypothetical protein